MRYEQSFYDSGELRWEQWYLDDKLHNEEGPAIIGYGRYGQVWWKQWFLHGVQYDEKEWSDLVFRKALEDKISG